MTSGGNLNKTGLPVNKEADENDAEPADAEVITWNAIKQLCDFQPAAGGGGQHVIKEEGIALPARSGLNFIGARITAIDDLAGNETDVTVDAELNTVTNVGTGEGIAKAKVGENTDLKSLLGTINEIILTGNANDITLSLAAIIERTTNKDVANGYAGLDAGTLLLLAQVPNLPTSRITSGIFVDARIPNLDTAKITTGQFVLARLPRAVDGRFFRSNGAASDPVIEAIEFSKGGTILEQTVAINVIVWRAPFACTVTNVRGYRVGGTGAVINARKNGTDDHLIANHSITVADVWQDAGAVQNAAYVAGDKLEIMYISFAGAPSQVAIQVDYTRP